MDYDYRERKLVAVLNSDLEPGVAMNVLGHLAVSIGHHAREHMGRDHYVDGSGLAHLGISRYAVIVTRVKAGTLRRAIEAARADGRILLTDYPRQMLETGHDDELAAAIAAADEASMEYLGTLLYGPSEAVDAITRKFQLWK